MIQLGQHFLKEIMAVLFITTTLYLLGNAVILRRSICWAMQLF